jgi:hypothetical protein
MGAGGKFAAACILGVFPGTFLEVLGSLPQGAAVAAELIVLTNQGATPGVREVAAAFERASGHKVTVLQEAGPGYDLAPADEFRDRLRVACDQVRGPIVDPLLQRGVGVTPGFLNKPCPSSVALMTVSKEPDAARALIRFMVSPEVAPLLRKTLVEPVTP